MGKGKVKSKRIKGKGEASVAAALLGERGLCGTCCIEHAFHGVRLPFLPLQHTFIPWVLSPTIKIK